MNHKISKVLRKIASLGYSAGVVSLIIGVLLSVVSQPVYASSQNTNNNNKIWICHIPPGNPGNAQAINVDASGWNGHDGHSGDFQISGPNDSACGVNDDDPTKTLNPTNTKIPTEVKQTETNEPTEVKETVTKEPTVNQEVTPTITLTPDKTKENDDHKIWICHLPPGNPENAQTLNVDANGWNGHDNHQGDFIIDGPNDPRCGAPTSTPTLMIENTLTSTATPTITASSTSTSTPTSTATSTATETPTSTATSTATATPTEKEVSFRRLSVDWQCVEGEQLWTITNPNGFSLAVSWLFSSGAGPGSATIPANSSTNFYVAGGYRTITVSWTDPGGVSQLLNMTTSPTSPCAVRDPNTPTPDPGGDPTSTPTTQTTNVVTNRLSDPRPTFVATLEATLDPSQELLIPVTGADFSNPFSNTPFGTLLINLGFIFFGMALLTHGISFKLK